MVYFDPPPQIPNFLTPKLISEYAPKEKEGF